MLPPQYGPCGECEFPHVTFRILEGFMGAEVPVAHLCDGNVYFIIPIQAVPGIRAELDKVYKEWIATCP